MSSWKCAVRRIYALGGEASIYEVGVALTNGAQAIYTAKEYGLVVPKSHCRWSLTEKGILYCQGRIDYYRHGIPANPKRTMKWRATWLLSLPTAHIDPTPQLEFMF